MVLFEVFRGPLEPLGLRCPFIDPILAPSGAQMGPKRVPKWSHFGTYFSGAFQDPSFAHFGSQNGTKSGPKSDTFLRGPTLLKYCK